MSIVVRRKRAIAISHIFYSLPSTSKQYGMKGFALDFKPNQKLPLILTYLLSN